MDLNYQPLLVPTAEAGGLLRISRTAVYGLAKEGKLKKIRIGRRSLITLASIEAFVAQLASSEGVDSKSQGQQCTSNRGADDAGPPLRDA